MTTIKITKEQLFKLLGETVTDTNKIGSLSIHLPHDPNNNAFVFIYEVIEMDPKDIIVDVIA